MHPKPNSLSLPNNLPRAKINQVKPSRFQPSSQPQSQLSKMCTNLTLFFSSCGHQHKELRPCPDRCAIPTIKNVTVDCCCSKECCNTFIQPVKDAQEKASAEMERRKLQANRGIFGIQVDIGLSSTTRHAVNNAPKMEVQREMNALMAVQARHVNCDVSRNQAMAED